MENPIFSIVVPVYNVEKYLRSCLDSILAQKVRNFEVILVDDGSTDKSGEICDEYVKNHPDIFSVIHKENEGLISARRTGFKNANGTYICNIDSDDLISRDMLEQITDIIKKHGSDMILFGYKSVDINGQFIGTPTADLFKEGEISKRELFEYMISSRNANPMWVKICKKSCYDINADYSPLYKVQIGEDLLQSLPLISNANSFYYCNKAFYFYRQNQSSLTHNYRKGQHRYLGVVRPTFYKYMVKLGFDSKQNTDLFYRQYGEIILSTVRGRINASNDGLYEDLEEIYNYEFVKNTKKYYKLCRFSVRCGLYLFYKKRWRTLIRLCNLRAKLHR